MEYHKIEYVDPVEPVSANVLSKLERSSGHRTWNIICRDTVFIYDIQIVLVHTVES